MCGPTKPDAISGRVYADTKRPKNSSRRRRKRMALWNYMMRFRIGGIWIFVRIPEITA